MRKHLIKELGQKTLFSIILFVTLFGLFYLIEWVYPDIQGRLLQWTLADGSINWAFIVGIPASLMGTAYVLTVKNPQNYFGFYMGIVMSLLLAVQFYLQGSYDLVVLYLCVFIPFQVASLITWRRQALQTPQDNTDFTPKFITIQLSIVVHIVALLIVAIDYIIATKLIHHDGWQDQMTMKLLAGCTIASSLLANLLMIYKKNDAWLCWVFYCITSIIMFVIIGNVFSLVMFTMMLIINTSAQLSWLMMTKSDHFGWAGNREYIERLIEQRTEMLIKRDGQREKVLQLQEKWLLNQLELNHHRRERLMTSQIGWQLVQGHIVDVVNERIYDGEIEISNGRIQSIRETTVAANTPYIMPGFVDSHIHIESTLLLPEQYARLAVTQGTIGVITDPHEVANVLGKEGIELMMKSANKVRFHFRFGIPSCVPATPFETSGAKIDAEDIVPLLKQSNVYGLGEMMNIPGVLQRDKDVMAKIQACLNQGKIVDGHCPKLTGDALKSYIASGIYTDHECTTLEEAREKLAAGMYIQIREGSAACDLTALSPILAEEKERVMFCSDDKYPDEMILGYLNDMVTRCVRRGLPMWSVLRAASVNPIKYYHMDCGLLQVGDSADFICVHDLIDFDVQKTYIKGRCVFADHHCTDEMVIDKSPSYTLEHYELCPNHFLAEPIIAEQIQVPAKEGKLLKVITTTEGSLLTREIHVTPKVENNLVVPDISQDVLKLVCLSRHSMSKPVVGFINGFGLKRGAIASTIGHDSHNIIALGTNDEDIVRAINHLISIKGGLVVCDGEELIDMELPIAGLMSVRTGRQVGKRHCQLKAMAERLGCRYHAPFMTLAFMPLPVIPELKITDKGLFDSTKFEYTSLWI